VKKKKEKKSKGGGGKSVDFGKYLRGLNRHLEKAKETAESTGFEEFDDGRYRMRAVDAKIGVSKNKRVQVVISWKFMDGDYKGKEKLDFEGLTEDHLPYLLKKLDAMGYDTSELENLEDDKKKSKKSKKSKKKDDEDEDEEEEEDEEESDDEDEDSDDEEESDDDEEESDDEEEDEDEEEEEPKKKGKKKSSKKDEDEEEEEEDEDEEDEDEEEVEDEVDVVVGSVVKADSKKLGKIKGEVVELFESDGKVLIKTDKGKTVKIKADSITSVEESPAASVPKKKKKSKK
jgi:hypothetical protein